jgi:hypothetical protein
MSYPRAEANGDWEYRYPAVVHDTNEISPIPPAIS